MQEEEYEWGNPKSKGKIPESNGEIENAIAAAAYRWRVKLQKQLDSPFSDIVALLMVSEEKYDQFKRLIEAGGGMVMQAKYVLINFRKKNISIIYYCDSFDLIADRLTMLVHLDAKSHTASLM